MSAVLVDELSVPARALLRRARAAAAADRLSAPVPTADRPAVVRELRPAGAAQVAPLAPLAPVVARPAGDGRAWRLTDRGIAVVLTLFVALFVTGVAVIVTSFLAVSEAPLGPADSMSVVAGSVR